MEEDAAAQGREDSLHSGLAEPWSAERGPRIRMAQCPESAHLGLHSPALLSHHIHKGEGRDL